MRRLIPLLAIALGVSACTTPPASTAVDRSTDPSPTLQPAASMVELAITSGDARLNGLVYLAAGPGVHPLVVFLHGYPGNEKDLDLAQAVRRAGYDALYVDYRGVWGSGGTFSFANALADTRTVLAWASDPANAAKYHFDNQRMAIVGHSFGGWLALMTASDEPASVCVAGLAAWNIGGAVKRFADHPNERASNLDDLRDSTDPAGGPVHAKADDLFAEMSSHADEWDYRSKAATIGDRAILLVAATRDTPDEDVAMHQDMERALRAGGTHRVTLIPYDDDHPFSSHRLALADALVSWLQGDCAASQGVRR
jgi:pimeloyl-ACP methyl ester carboxylesterase